MFECKTEWEYDCKKNGHFILKTKKSRCPYCRGRIKVKKVHRWAGFFHDASEHRRPFRKLIDVLKVPVMLAVLLAALLLFFVVFLLSAIFTVFVAVCVGLLALFNRR